MKNKFMPFLLLLVLVLSGCRPMAPDVVPEAERVLRLYASFYSIYGLALNVVQDVPGVALMCLTQPQDGCLRSYAFSEWDATLLSMADALIIGGRGLETFESLVMASALPVVGAMDGALLLGADESTNEESSHFVGANPWLWLSPDGARAMAKSIAGAMAALDPKHEAQYQANLAAFSERLDALMVDIGARGEVVLMHEGLAYLADAMGLTVVATVEREPGTDAEAAELQNALDTLRSAGAQVVLIEAQAPDRLVRDLEKAGHAVVRIDTLTTHTEADADVYIDAMRQNAARVRKALEK